MVYLNFGTVNDQLDDIALSKTSEGFMQERPLMHLLFGIFLAGGVNALATVILRCSF